MNTLCHDPCITCPPVPGASGILPDPNAEANPFSNFSSEKPDRLIDTGRNPNGTDGPGNPPLGKNWQSTGCIGICISEISQADADICAFNQKVLCDPPFDFCALFPNHPACLSVNPPQPDPPRLTYYNDEQECTVVCPDGTPLTVVVPGGTYVQFSKAQANAIALSVACKRAELEKVCVNPISATAGCIDNPFFATVTLNTSFENTSSYGIAVTAGFLPPGLSFQMSGPRSGVISGTPTVTGTFVFTLTYTPPSGIVFSRQYTITVAAISTTALPAGSVGTPYSFFLTAQGATGTVFWGALNAFPAGLSLNTATGEIAGTPTAATSASGTAITIQMQDGSRNCFKNFNLVVNASACPDWSAIVWDPPSLTAFGAGASASATMIGASITAATAVADQENENASVTNLGFLNYNGIGCNCNFHYETTIVDTNGAAGWSFALTNNTDALLIFNVTSNVTGVFDVPFVLPNTLGATKVYAIQVSGGCGAFTPPPNPSQSDVIALFSNVP